MKSMTGYGEGAQSVRGTRVTVQVRTLNHRHLDLQLRVPREYLPLEEEIRKTLRGKIARGRIDLFVNRFIGKGPARKLEMDQALVGQYIAGVKQIKKRYGLAGEVGVSLLANIPDLVQVREPEPDAAGERQALMKALTTALQQLERSREREGGHLRADIESQLRHLKRIAENLETRILENPLRSPRAGAAADGGNGHGEREVFEPSSALSKGDVNEEIVRLKSHLTALAKVVREREPIGKKIDFMLQEVHRELNTVSSKVPYLPVVQLVLEGKERVEKIREQAQNVE